MTTSVCFDHSRADRIGLPEAIFCQGKDAMIVAELAAKFGRSSKYRVLFTRLSAKTFSSFPENVRAGLDYHSLSGTAWGNVLPKREKGKVAVVSAGTADGCVTWEAARTLEYLGINRSVFEDVGVAGLWRLQERLPEIDTHDVVIVVAGMDAALASVLGGLTSKPVIAVPTSVGYGMTKGGETALNAMLASCASGIAVQNIDNGYGAACAAARVVNLL